MDNTDPLLTTTEVARLLAVGEDTIRRYAEAGTLTAVRLPGKHYRFRRADVLALMTPAAPVAGDAA